MLSDREKYLDCWEWEPW